MCTLAELTQEDRSKMMCLFYPAIRRTFLLLVLCGWASSVRAVQTRLDIYFEESHAGTFYHLAETLPLETPHRLILIDAHSDASAMADSDKIRDGIRKVPTQEARQDLLNAWRKRGTIQCFDWIEPLMPLPFDEVVWIPARKLSRLEAGRQQTLARESLDGLREAFPRRDGDLGERFRVLDWEKAEDVLRTPAGGKPTVVSIDLDYFAAVPDDELEAEFCRVFLRVLEVPDLRSLTFSFSSPWLRNIEQAERLAVLALESATSTANARVHFAYDANTGADRSLRAQEIRKKGLTVPALQLSDAGPALRTLLLARRGRFAVDPGPKELLDAWARDPFLPKAVVAGDVPEPDGWYRLAASGSHSLRLQQADGARIRWHALVADHASVNVAGIRLGFAEDAPRMLHRSSKVIGEGAELSCSALRSLLEPNTEAGSVVVYATAERVGELWRSNELRLAFRTGDGFRGVLSEGFARPYAFGCGLLDNGPDDLIASDCANFVIAALRREGWIIPWGDPKQFATHCVELGAWKDRDLALAVPKGAVDAGLFVHFGSHVGVVWEDRVPVGQLDASDLIAHHLEGLPEIVPLSKLLAKRSQFRLLKFREDPNETKLIFGGDVMLGRGVAAAIKRGTNPLEKITPLLSRADWACVNLECVASEKGAADPGQRCHFRAHPETPNLLRAAGIDAVSLANNHARDFGDKAFADAAQRLRAAGVACADGGLEPVRFEKGWQRFAVFAFNDSPSDALLKAMKVESEHSTVIAMAHWGTEHSTEPRGEDRDYLGQLIRAGVDLVIGSGPHARQGFDFELGTLVAWSLGNLVFDGPGPNAEWSNGALLEVQFRSDGKISRVVQRPVKIRDNGVCELK